ARRRPNAGPSRPRERRRRVPLPRNSRTITMSQSVRSRGRVARLLLAAGLVGLVFAAGSAPGQQGQNPNPGPSGPTFYIGLPVNTNDKKHEEAVKKATEYLEGLKNNAQNQALEATRAKDRLPPEYPGEKGAEAPAVTSPADIAASAAVPPIGPAGALWAAPTAARPAPPAPEAYRWVKLTGDRELRILKLAPTAKTDADEDVKKVYDAAAKARADGKVFPHPDFNWPIYSRDAGGAV